MHRTNQEIWKHLMCNTQHTMRPAQVPETDTSFLRKQIHGSKVRTKGWGKTNKLWRMEKQLKNYDLGDHDSGKTPHSDLFKQSI